MTTTNLIHISLSLAILFQLYINYTTNKTMTTMLEMFVNIHKEIEDHLERIYKLEAKLNQLSENSILMQIERGFGWGGLKVWMME